MMTTTRPETHLLRELHVLAGPIVLLVGLLTGRFVEQRIGPQQVLQTFGILFLAAAVTFWILGWIRSRRLPVRPSIWSMVLSAMVNMAAVGGTLLAFIIWYNKWPLNLEPVEPTGFEGASGESFFIALMLFGFSGLAWLLGILAVGSTPAKPKV